MITWKITRHLLKPIRKNNELVIKTVVKPRRPSLPSKRPFSNLYQIGKQAVKFSGYYEKYNLRRYDPDVLYEKHVKRYSYKPRKRLTGYALRTKGFLRKKTYGSNSKFYQKRIFQQFRYNEHCNGKNICQSR